MRISRRIFLTELLVAPVVWVDVSYAAYQDRLSIASLKITVPAWLFSEQGKDKTKVDARSITVDRQADELIVSFAGNSELRLSPGTSVRSLSQGKNRHLTRKAMLLKRIIAYSLDAIFSDIANKRHPERGMNLAAEFAVMQHAAIVEEITIGALRELLVELNMQEMISSVTWNSGTKGFVVV